MNQATFTFKPPKETDRVCLIGSFNQWDPEKGQMKKTDGNTFVKVLYLQDGDYPYLFMTDESEYYTDPDNRHKERNEYGAYNSVLRLGRRPPDVVHRLDRWANGEVVFKVKIASSGGCPASLRLVANETAAYEMTAFLADGEWNYYLFRLRDEAVARSAFTYYFLLDGEKYAVADGVSSRKPEPDKRYVYDPGRLGSSRVPAWLTRAVFYHIFPDRFANGNLENDPEQTERWGERPTLTNYFGGDLQGVIDRLDYLSGLGVDTLYLNPVFASPSNHGYDISDFYRIAPRLGDENLWRQLVAEARKRRMRIVLDMVYNHTSTEFFAFQDVMEKGERSRFADWYYIEKYPVVVKPNPDYSCWFDYKHMPKLNLDNPDTKAYLQEATAYWLRQGISGFRVDTVKDIPHAFCKEMRSVVKAVNPEACLIGEVWESGEPWLRGDEFDGVTNYVFWGAATDFFAKRAIPLEVLIENLKRQLFEYPFPHLLAQANLLSSHDTVRFLSAVGGNKAVYSQAYAFLFAYPGVPLIYYGDEIGLEGGADPDNRRCMIWDGPLHDEGIKSRFARLIALRKQFRPLREGNAVFLEELAASRILALKREIRDEEVYFFANVSDNPITVDLSSCVPADRRTSLIYPCERENPAALALQARDFAFVFAKRQPERGVLLENRGQIFD